jgi:hypothetical protein
MEEPPQEERASPFGRWFDGVFQALIALIGGAMVVTMFTELDWSAPWWLTTLTIPPLMAVAGGLAWVLTCAILFALAAAADFVIWVRESLG